MPIDPQQLDCVFEFLTLNTRWNEEFQNFEYTRSLSYCGSANTRLHQLLRSTAETQSQPKMGSLAPFWRSLYNFQANGPSTLASFTLQLEALHPVKAPATGPWERLYHALKGQPGWGEKTSALFVKNVIRVHRGTRELQFWEDARALADPLPPQDRIFLPVDRVIVRLFEALGMEGAGFNSVNRVLQARYTPEDLLVWDDLWYWGFFTQVVRKDAATEAGSPGSRVMEWNSDKFWCQLASQKAHEPEIRDLAETFISLIPAQP